MGATRSKVSVDKCSGVKPDECSCRCFYGPHDGRQLRELGLDKSPRSRAFSASPLLGAVQSSPLGQEMEYMSTRVEVLKTLSDVLQCA